MAAFCHKCTMEMFGEQLMPFNDMVRKVPGLYSDLCEHCGFGIFDERGRRDPLSPKCPHDFDWDKCRIVAAKSKTHIAYVSGLNFHDVGEFIAQYPEGDASSCEIKDYVPTCNTWEVIDRMLTP